MAAGEDAHDAEGAAGRCRGELVVGDFDDPVAAADRNAGKRRRIFGLEAALRGGRAGRIGRQGRPTTAAASAVVRPKATRAPRTDRTLRSKHLGKSFTAATASLMTARAPCGRAARPEKIAGFTAASDSAVRADCLVGECVVSVFRRAAVAVSTHRLNASLPGLDALLPGLRASPGGLNGALAGLDALLPGHYRSRNLFAPGPPIGAVRAKDPKLKVSRGIRAMSRRCELTGKIRQIGHKVSHSNRKTKRRFMPNLLNVTLHVRRARPHGAHADLGQRAQDRGPSRRARCFPAQGQGRRTVAARARAQARDREEARRAA